MGSGDADGLIREVIDAHGGATLWSGLIALEAELSAWGFLFTAKWRRRLHRVRVWASIREPRFVFHDHLGRVGPASRGAVA